MTFDLEARVCRDPAPAMQEPLPRSAGPLDASAVHSARLQGRTLAFDPMQSGWVFADLEDDLCADVHDAPQLAAPRGPAARIGHAAPADSSALMLGPYRLRPWRATDAARFAALLGDEAVWRHLPERYPGSLCATDAAGMIALVNERGGHDVLAIEHEGAEIGQVRLEFAAGGTAAELSYWFGRAYWGSGHASRVVPAFVAAAAARHPRLDRLTARVHDGNPASSAVLARAGFSRAPETDAPPWRFFARALR
jgi:RimJ/RimL family protein N-acetyltransferase